MASPAAPACRLRLEVEVPGCEGAAAGSPQEAVRAALAQHLYCPYPTRLALHASPDLVAGVGRLHGDGGFAFVLGQYRAVSARVGPNVSRLYDPAGPVRVPVLLFSDGGVLALHVEDEAPARAEGAARAWPVSRFRYRFSAADFGEAPATDDKADAGAGAATGVAEADAKAATESPALAAAVAAAPPETSVAVPAADAVLRACFARPTYPLNRRWAPVLPGEGAAAAEDAEREPGAEPPPVYYALLRHAAMRADDWCLATVRLRGGLPAFLAEAWEGYGSTVSAYLYCDETRVALRIDVRRFRVAGTAAEPPACGVNRVYGLVGMAPAIPHSYDGLRPFA